MKALVAVFSLLIINCSCVMAMENMRQSTFDEFWEKKNAPPFKEQLSLVINQSPLNRDCKNDVFECMRRNTNQSGIVSWPQVCNGLKNIKYDKPFAMKNAIFLSLLSLCNFIFGLYLLAYSRTDTYGGNKACLFDKLPINVFIQILYVFQLLGMYCELMNSQCSKTFYSELQPYTPKLGERAMWGLIFVASKFPMACVVQQRNGNGIVLSETLSLRNGWNSIETLLGLASVGAGIMYRLSFRDLESQKKVDTVLDQAIASIDEHLKREARLSKKVKYQ